MVLAVWWECDSSPLPVSCLVNVQVLCMSLRPRRSRMVWTSQLLKLGSWSPLTDLDTPCWPTHGLMEVDATVSASCDFLVVGPYCLSYSIVQGFRRSELRRCVFCDIRLPKTTASDADSTEVQQVWYKWGPQCRLLDASTIIFSPKGKLITLNELTRQVVIC